MAVLFVTCAPMYDRRSFEQRQRKIWLSTRESEPSPSMSPLQPLYAQVADLNSLRAHLTRLLPQGGKGAAGQSKLAPSDAGVVS